MHDEVNFQIDPDNPDQVRVSSKSRETLEKMGQLAQQRMADEFQRIVVKMTTADRSMTAYHLGAASITLSHMVRAGVAPESLKTVGQALIDMLERRWPGLHGELGNPLAKYTGPFLA
jgi:hypothetical protein